MTEANDEARLAESLEALAMGYIPASVLFAAVDLRLFDALDEPRSFADIAARTNATVDGIERMCRVLATMGLVIVEAEVASATPAAMAVLSSHAPRSRARLLRHHHRHLAPPMLRLAESVRTGLPQHSAWPFAGQPAEASPYAELAAHPDEYEAFLSAMDDASRGVGRSIARAVDLREARRLVDFGCGGGQVARELLESQPDLRVESFDVGPAVSIARARSAKAGLGSRHVVSIGDLFDRPSELGADAVLLSAVLADWPAIDRAKILSNAAHALRPGGMLLVSESLFDDDRRGPPKVAMLSLFMLAALRGDQLSGRDLAAEIAAVGFGEIEVLRMSPRDLVVARWP